MRIKRKESGCPMTKILALLSERYMLSLLFDLSAGSKGSNDLQTVVDVNTATLPKRLVALEEEVLVEKRACKIDSCRHYYALTKRDKKISKYIKLFSQV